MKLDDLDPVGGIDAMQGDMAQHQRMFRGEVTGEQNRLMAVEAMTRLEQEWADAKPVPPPAPAPAPPPVERVEKRTIDDRAYTLSTRGVDDTAFRPPSESERWFMEHAMPRIEILMTKFDRGPLGQPSYAERVLAVMALQQTDRARYLCELVELLEDSNKHFGDWKADRARRIQVG